MKPIEEYFCNVMHDFVKKHINEVKDSWEYLGFVNSEDLLNQIKTDVDNAYWALTELCSWGLAEDYCNDMFSVYQNFKDDYFAVYKLGDKYIKTELPDKVVITEVEKRIKLVEVVEWQNKE